MSVSIVAVILALGVGAFLVFRGRSAHSTRSMPQTLQIAPGISATVVDTVDPSASFLCSKCYKTYPVSELHVVPTFDETTGRYVGGYRCKNDWRNTIAETRQQSAAYKPPDESAAVVAVGSFLEVFRNRGLSD